MPTPNPFTPEREAVTKLLIAQTDLGEAAFHFANALKRIEEATKLAPEGSALALGCSMLRLIPAAALPLPRFLFTNMQAAILKLAAAHYPEVLTEEI